MTGPWQPASYYYFVHVFLLPHRYVSTSPYRENFVWLPMIFEARQSPSGRWKIWTFFVDDFDHVKSSWFVKPFFVVFDKGILFFDWKSCLPRKSSRLGSFMDTRSEPGIQVKVELNGGKVFRLSKNRVGPFAEGISRKNALLDEAAHENDVTCLSPASHGGIGLRPS